MEVFFSYAHEDENFRDALVRHLTPLQRQGIITTWHDRKITAGQEWKKAVDSHLESADIILLLISADFVASEYCYDIELARALNRHEKGEARVIPVILRSVDWHESIMGNNPSHFTGDGKLPVDSVSWLDAMDFCQKLSQKTGRAYRLPSEAEWEYACRADTQTPFAFGETITSAVVNHNGGFPYASAAKGEHRGKTTPVDLFPANGFGLYDMHGNLWEWCLDEWVDNYNNSPTNGSAREGVSQSANDSHRLLRGGSWLHRASFCRSASRLTIAHFTCEVKHRLAAISVQEKPET